MNVFLRMIVFKHFQEVNFLILEYNFDITNHQNLMLDDVVNR